jgi:hypothetical protein
MAASNPLSAFIDDWPTESDDGPTETNDKTAEAKDNITNSDVDIANDNTADYTGGEDDPNWADTHLIRGSGEIPPSVCDKTAYFRELRSQEYGSAQKYDYIRNSPLSTRIELQTRILGGELCGAASHFYACAAERAKKQPQLIPLLPAAPASWCHLFYHPELLAQFCTAAAKFMLDKSTTPPELPTRYMQLWSGDMREQSADKKHEFELALLEYIEALEHYHARCVNKLREYCDKLAQ